MPGTYNAPVERCTVSQHSPVYVFFIRLSVRTPSSDHPSHQCVLFSTVIELNRAWYCSANCCYWVIISLVLHALDPVIPRGTMYCSLPISSVCLTYSVQGFDSLFNVFFLLSSRSIRYCSSERLFFRNDFLPRLFRIQDAPGTSLRPSFPEFINENCLYFWDVHLKSSRQRNASWIRNFKIYFVL